jgi:hypothetical protein
MLQAILPHTPDLPVATGAHELAARRPVRSATAYILRWVVYGKGYERMATRVSSTPTARQAELQSLFPRATTTRELEKDS